MSECCHCRKRRCKCDYLDGVRYVDASCPKHAAWTLTEEGWTLTVVEEARLRRASTKEGNR